MLEPSNSSVQVNGYDYWLHRRASQQSRPVSLPRATVQPKAAGDLAQAQNNHQGAKFCFFFLVRLLVLFDESTPLLKRLYTRFLSIETHLKS